MVKKSLIVVLAILFTSALTTHVWAADYDELEKKIEDLSQALEKLEGMVKDLSFQVQQEQALASIVKELSFEFKKTESAVHDLTGIGKKVDEEIQPRLLTLEGTIQGVAASFREKFDVFQGRVFDLETTVQGLDARLKSIEGKVRELLNLEMQVKQLDKRITFLEQTAKMPSNMPADAAMMQIMNQIKDLKDHLTMVEGTTADLSTQLDKDRSRIASLETSKADVEEVEALQAHVTQLEQQMRTEIDDLKSQTSLNSALAGLGLVAGLVALGSVFGIF